MWTIVEIKTMQWTLSINLAAFSVIRKQFTSNEKPEFKGKKLIIINKNRNESRANRSIGFSPDIEES